MKKTTALLVTSALALGMFINVVSPTTTHAAARNATVIVKYVDGKRVLKTAKTKVQLKKKFVAKKLNIKGYLAPKKIKAVKITKNQTIKVAYKIRTYTVTVKYITNSKVLKQVPTKVAFNTQFSPVKLSFTGYMAPKNIRTITIRHDRNFIVKYQQDHSKLFTDAKNAITQAKYITDRYPSSVIGENTTDSLITLSGFLLDDINSERPNSPENLKVIGIITQSLLDDISKANKMISGNNDSLFKKEFTICDTIIYKDVECLRPVTIKTGATVLTFDNFVIYNGQKFYSESLFNGRSFDLFNTDTYQEYGLSEYYSKKAPTEFLNQIPPYLGRTWIQYTPSNGKDNITIWKTGYNSETESYAWKVNNANN
ncbi:hypothetical protein EQG49_03655 [Periweissella cryptocerci]|uniref:Surface layer protein A domain-containing protein n=1 Tax=Periweissella cryptocerci TaxID=2506420 RepID=A0A4P6YSE4_9LACO|nr:hypothetical protein [Periweissella cryptocerci]QBO35618.1 hypothetical protein EQG49_03655 [Periweissella cryptocerci]